MRTEHSISICRGGRSRQSRGDKAARGAGQYAAYDDIAAACDTKIEFKPR